MTAKTRTIDELIKLSLKVGNAWLNKPTNTGNAIISKAILAVCQYLSHEAGYRYANHSQMKVIAAFSSVVSGTIRCEFIFFPRCAQ